VFSLDIGYLLGYGYKGLLPHFTWE
jgi:hypothetical protein